MASKTITIYHTSAEQDVVQWTELFCKHLQLVFHSYISKDTTFTVEQAFENSDFANNLFITHSAESASTYSEKLSSKNVLSVVSLGDIDISFAQNPFQFYTDKDGRFNISNVEQNISQSFYWEQLIDLAFSLGVKPLGSASEQLTVYLGEVGKDQQYNRDVIRRELQQLGYNVIPKIKLPHTQTEVVDTVSRSISDLSAVILFVGTDFGRTVSGSNVGVVELQHALFQELLPQQNTEIPLMLWFEDVKMFHSDQELSYLQRMQQAVSVGSGTELIQTPIEKFKQVAIQRIKNALAKSLIQKSSNSEKKQVYVIGGEQSVGKVKSEIGESYNLLAQTATTPSEMLLEHRTSLSKTDALVICLESQSIEWLRAKLQDALKATGFGRTSAIAQTIILSGGRFIPDEMTEHYKNLLSIDVIPSNDISSLQPLLKNL